MGQNNVMPYPSRFPLYGSAAAVVTPPTIGFVNVGNANGGTPAATAASVTYSPTAGNTVVAFLGLGAAPGTFSGVLDSASHALTAGAFINSGINVYLYCYYYTAPAGIVSFSASWTNATEWGLTVVEYSGVTSVNAGQSGNTNTGVSTTPSITNTTQDANDWIVAGLANHSLSNEISITTGNLRNMDAGSPINLTVADNTSATAGGVSIIGSQTSTAWAAVSIELRT